MEHKQFKREKPLHQMLDLKCVCDKHDKKVPCGETFLQFYFLSQRRTHYQLVNSISSYPMDIKGHCDLYRITFADVKNLKSLASYMSMMRSFFLLTDQDSDKTRAIDIVDATIAIFLFEMSRNFKRGRTSWRRDQIQF